MRWKPHRGKLFSLTTALPLCLSAFSPNSATLFFPLKKTKPKKLLCSFRLFFVEVVCGWLVGGGSGCSGQHVCLVVVGLFFPFHCSHSWVFFFYFCPSLKSYDFLCKNKKRGKFFSCCLRVREKIYYIFLELC